MGPAVRQYNTTQQAHESTTSTRHQLIKLGSGMQAVQHKCKSVGQYNLFYCCTPQGP
jgi:hypothetical protein